MVRVITRQLAGDPVNGQEARDNFIENGKLRAPERDAVLVHILEKVDTIEEKLRSVGNSLEGHLEDHARLWRSIKWIGSGLLAVGSVVAGALGFRAF